MQLSHLNELQTNKYKIACYVSNLELLSIENFAFIFSYFATRHSNAFNYLYEKCNMNKQKYINDTALLERTLLLTCFEAENCLLQ